MLGHIGFMIRVFQLDEVERAARSFRSLAKRQEQASGMFCYVNSHRERGHLVRILCGQDVRAPRQFRSYNDIFIIVCERNSWELLRKLSRN